MTLESKYHDQSAYIPPGGHLDAGDVPPDRSKGRVSLQKLLIGARKLLDCVQSKGVINSDKPENQKPS